MVNLLFVWSKHLNWFWSGIGKSKILKIIKIPTIKVKKFEK